MRQSRRARPTNGASSGLEHAADDVSARIASTRATTLQAVELTERALREFRANDDAESSGDRRRRRGAKGSVDAPYGGDDDDFTGRGDDSELSALVQQLESFAEKRTGAGHALRAGGGDRHSTDKWSVKSGESGDGGNDENSLVGYSMMYGSTVDDGASVGNVDDLDPASEFDAFSELDFELRGSERGQYASRQGGRREHTSEIGSVSGRIDAVSDSLMTSKERLHESIASLELEAGLMSGGATPSDFEQYRDDNDMPVVGKSKTGNMVIDYTAQGVNALSRSSSKIINTAEKKEDDVLARIFNGLFGCCVMRQ